jgi:hypothetical protein
MTDKRTQQDADNSNMKKAPKGVNQGEIWWLIGIALAIGYFIFLYRFFRGKVRLTDQGY